MKKFSSPILSYKPLFLNRETLSFGSRLIMILIPAFLASSIRANNAASPVASTTERCSMSRMIFVASVVRIFGYLSSNTLAVPKKSGPSNSIFFKPSTIA